MVHIPKTQLGIILYTDFFYTNADRKTFKAIIIIRASLVAQLVRNLPAMQETQVQSPGWENPLEE